jgi:hypothetical protein
MNEIVHQGPFAAPEDAELADILDRMKNPDATTLIRDHTQ